MSSLDRKSPTRTAATLGKTVLLQQYFLAARAAASKAKGLVTVEVNMAASVQSVAPLSDQREQWWLVTSPDWDPSAPPGLLPT